MLFFKVVGVFCSFRGIAVLQRRLWWRWTLKTKHSCCPGERLQTTTMSLWLSETLTTLWSSYRNSREEKKTVHRLPPILCCLTLSFCIILPLNQNTDLSPLCTKRQHLVWEYIAYWFCLFSRDLVLLKCGSWSKKIEVAKASKGEEISVNLISSQYGKPWKYLCI